MLHVNYVTGRLTEGWLQNQVAGTIRYESWLLTRSVAEGTARPKTWIVSDDRLSRRLLHRAAGKTGGHSAALLASSLPFGTPGVLHAHFGPVAWAHRRLASRLNAPLAVGFYGADATAQEYVGSRRWRRRYADLFAQAAAVLAEGPAMAARLVALGASPEQVYVVPLAADAASLGDLSWTPPDDRAFRFVAGGRFTEKKGLDTAIRAFARAFGPRDNVELLLVGAGPDGTALRRLAGSLGVAEQVIFAGALPHRQFIARFATAHVALFPSRTASDGDSEGGAPVTIIETQWVGTPVIVSDHDDLSFVAAPGSLVAPARDVGRWAELMRTVAGEPTLLAEMSSAARRHARSRHSPERNTRQREDCYDSIRG